MTGDQLAIDRRAPVRRIDLDATSWVDLVEGFVGDPAGELRAIRDATEWGQTEVLRYDRYIPENRLGASIRSESVALLRQTELHLSSRYRIQRWDGVAAILYRNGEDFQGLHGDREMRWLDDTVIAIMVLGVRRPFVLRPRRRGVPQMRDGIPAGQGEHDVVLMPGEGDLLVMGGANQRDWLHSVPRATTDQERISLTWRWSSRRGRPDTNPGYADGRQYSDRPRQPGSRPHRP